MPIRVEHGPNLAPVGQLAYQTGQLEYRNKRRTELERLAMQQAEMRQRAQQQQNQIAASLQGQKMSHMNAMQRLAVGQQFGQINAEQANQWKVQADVKAQENRMIWGKQLGQNQLDLANLNAGLADQKGIEKLQWNQEWAGYKQTLNPTGQAAILENERLRQIELNSPKNNPAEHGNINAQFDNNKQNIINDKANTVDAELQPGTQSVHIAHSLTPDQVVEKDPEIRKRNEAMVGQPKVYKTVKVRNPDGSVVYEYTPATTKMIEGPDGNMLELPLSAQQIHDNTTTIVRRGGRDYLGHLNSTNGIYEVDDNAKPIDTPEWLAQQAEIKRAEAEREAKRKWDTEREKDRQNVIANYEGPDSHPGEEAPAIVRMALDPVKWRNNFKYPEAPVPQAQQDQVIPLDDAAPAVPLEQQPVAPVADAGDVNIGPQGGLPGLGQPMPAPEEQFAQQQQLQQQQQQQQRDPTQALGDVGNPHPDPATTPVGQYFQTADMPTPMLRQQ